MSDQPSTRQVPVRQMRLVVHVEDYDAALHSYRDVLGLPQRAAYEGDGDARVAILDAGAATLELANPTQGAMTDAVEAGGSPSARLRVAFEVDDAVSATDRLLAAGATLIAAPITTPWRSVNSRLAAPADLQLTLFQELENYEQRTRREGSAALQE